MFIPSRGGPLIGQAAQRQKENRCREDQRAGSDVSEDGLVQSGIFGGLRNFMQDANIRGFFVRSSISKNRLRPPSELDFQRGLHGARTPDSIERIKASAKAIAAAQSLCQGLRG